MRANDLTRYAQFLRASDYVQLPNSTTKRHQGYFSLPEARLLGLSVHGTLNWLANLTKQGQFLAFDTRAGRLIDNPAVPEQCRLLPNEADSHDVILPGWAFRPLKDDSHLAIPGELRNLFRPRPQEVEMRRKARASRLQHAARKSVRYCPAGRK